MIFPWTLVDSGYGSYDSKTGQWKSEACSAWQRWLSKRHGRLVKIGPLPVLPEIWADSFVPIIFLLLFGFGCFALGRLT